MFSKSIGKILLSALTLMVGLQIATAQTSKRVSGTVLDEKNEVVAGASITVKGQTRGVLADNEGKFEIDVKSSDVLLVYFLGYEEQAVTVGNKTEFIITLVPTSDALDEVTIVAYGAQRKASVIGSISSVSTEKLATGVRGNLSTGLAGQLAGIVSVQTSGEPGTSANFWIRGVNTFGANSTPLVLVDGVERSMDLVDVEDIASFSILKDATATAVYGVRGANGIILITTKRGSETAPKVSVKFESGVTQPVVMPKVASTAQWIDYYNELFIDQGSDPAISDYDRAIYVSGEDPDHYPSVNWVDTIFKSMASTDKANISVTGGNKNIRYYVGGSYYYEDGIFNMAQNDHYDAQLDYNKFSFRSNVDMNITPSTTLGLSLSTAYTDKNAPNTDRANLYAYTLYFTPIATPAVFSDGTLACPSNTSNNPYNMLNSTGYRHYNEIVAQSLVSLTQDFSDIITKGLTANVKFSWDAFNAVTLTRSKVPTYYYLGYDEDGNETYIPYNADTASEYMSLGRANSSTTTTNLEASINYDREFGHHRVGAMALFSMRSHSNNVPASYVYAFPYKNIGVAGRATYSYKDKYFGEFNFGYNGSENFAPGHRFGFFPSYAVGYLVSNEEYWEPLRNVVNNLKLKASYGKIGNDQIGGNRRFAYNTTIETAYSGFTFGQNGGGSWVTGISTGDYGNALVGWEEATKTNLGLELGLFYEFNLQVDYFSDFRDGIFIQRQSTPSVVGLNKQQWVNIGQMKNSGVDLSVEYNHQFHNGLSLSARANYTYNRNMVVYNDQPDQIWKYQNTVGFAYGQQRGLIAEGLFVDQDDIDNWPVQTFSTVRPGDIKYRDINGDGKVDQYDMVAIGYSTIPEINYGFGLSLGWKGFDASVFFSGVDHYTRIIGGNLLWGASYQITTMGQILADVAENRWTLENQNPNAPYPRLMMTTNTNNQQSSTYWQRDMSFMRLKNAEIGYTVPKNLTKKAHISALRFYLQGVNLLTFSKFKLWDPELAASYGNAYPTMRSVSFGINLNF